MFISGFCVFNINFECLQYFNMVFLWYTLNMYVTVMINGI